ncbi:MAG: hypothetical protein Q8S31_00555 [Alphaproteobacteria bacterium]|nr:hypothetical protein [Alphaproteobacteria bacterium]
MRVLFFVLFATFCVSKIEALIVNESAIMQKIFNKQHHHVHHPNYFDFSDLILNDDESPLPSGLWFCSNNGFFENFDADLSEGFTVVIADVDERYAILFKRNDDSSKCFCIDQLKYNDNDFCVVGAVIANMKADLSAFLQSDIDDPASTLKSLDAQIQSIEQTPHLYDALYFDEAMDDIENDEQEEGAKQYTMPNFLQEHLEELKVKRDSLTEFTQELLSLDQILARLSVDETTQHLELNKKLIILQSMGFF